MKKLLTLMLVLFLASAANAIVVTFSTDGGSNDSDDVDLVATAGGSYTIDVLSDTGGTGGVYWSYLEMDLPSDGTVADDDPETNITINTNAGNLADVTDYSVSDLLDVELFAGDSAGNIVAGIHFTFSLDIDSGWDETPFDIWLTGPNDDTYTEVAWLHVIPEPMTIALLGLGGLLLRRRK
jgi:hypothetical protein